MTSLGKLPEFQAGTHSQRRAVTGDAGQGVAHHHTVGAVVVILNVRQGEGGGGGSGDIRPRAVDVLLPLVTERLGAGGGDAEGDGGTGGGIGVGGAQDGPGGSWCDLGLNLLERGKPITQTQEIVEGSV